MRVYPAKRAQNALQAGPLTRHTPPLTVKGETMGRGKTTLSLPLLFRTRPKPIESCMLAKRVIPCLDVDRGRVVKGTNFVNLRDAGDPVEVAARYEAEGAD